MCCGFDTPSSLIKSIPIVFFFFCEPFFSVLFVVTPHLNPILLPIFLRAEIRRGVLTAVSFLCSHSTATSLLSPETTCFFIIEERYKRRFPFLFFFFFIR